MGRLLPFERVARDQDHRQGGDHVALPSAPGLREAWPAGYAEGNRLRALSWLSYTVARLVEEGGPAPVPAIDAAIREGNEILRSLARMDLNPDPTVQGYAAAADAIEAIQERIERWRRLIVG